MGQENDKLLKLKSLLETRRDILATLANKYMQENTLLKETKLDEKKMSAALRAEQRHIEKMSKLDLEIDGLLPDIEQLMKTKSAEENGLISAIRDLLKDMDIWSAKVGAYNTENKALFEGVAEKKRSNIKQFRNTKTVINRYGLNMKDSHMPDTSYFLDKKK